jgi:O-antigen/teichoic acid export membrane protein
LARAGALRGQVEPRQSTQILGPAAVPIFVVAHRLFTLPHNLVFISTAPFVSAYGEAKARGDWYWIRGALKRSMIASVRFGFTLTVLIALASRSVIRIWAGPAAVLGSSLVLWLTVYSLLAISVVPPAQMLWGLERVGLQALGLALCAVATVQFGILFPQWWGLAGVALAMSLSLLCTYCAVQIYEVRRALNTCRVSVRYAEPCAESLSV